MLRSEQARWSTRILAAATTLSAIMLALGGAAATPAAAQPAAIDNPEARAGDLRVVQLWSTDPTGFRATLERGQPLAPLVTKQVARNQPVQLFLFYADCQRDPDNHCWLRARMTITGPDGKLYGQPVVYDAVPLGPAAPRGTLGLAPNGITLVIETGEQLGRYRIELAVTDEVAVQTAVSVVHLDFVEAAPASVPRKP